MGHLWSIKHTRRVHTACGLCRLGKAGVIAQVTRAIRGLEGAPGPPQSWGDCSRNTRYSWAGWTRAAQSHSGGLARSFSWKGSRCRHCPRSCSSITCSSAALAGGSSGLRLLLGCRLRMAALHRTPAATSIDRAAVMAAPTRMSAWRRKKLIPAREVPWPHPACPKCPLLRSQSPSHHDRSAQVLWILLQRSQHFPYSPE